jgi:NAD(P)H-flavin reductase
MTADETQHTVCVRTRHVEAEGQLRISLDVADGARARHQHPGQFIELLFGESASERGYFALLNAPGEGETFELLVRTDAADGGDAAARLGLLDVRANVQAVGPLGDGFPLDRIGKRAVRVVATGTAIAPARAAIDHLLRHRVEVLSLDYGVRSAAHIALAPELARFSEAGVTVAVHFSAFREGVLLGQLAHRALMHRWSEVAVEEEVILAVGQLEMVAELRARWQALGGDPADVLHNY